MIPALEVHFGGLPQHFLSQRNLETLRLFIFNRTRTWWASKDIARKIDRWESELRGTLSISSSYVPNPPLTVSRSGDYAVTPVSYPRPQMRAPSVHCCCSRRRVGNNPSRVRFPNHRHQLPPHSGRHRGNPSASVPSRSQLSDWHPASHSLEGNHPFHPQPRPRSPMHSSWSSRHPRPDNRTPSHRFYPPRRGTRVAYHNPEPQQTHRNGPTQGRDPVAHFLPNAKAFEVKTMNIYYNGARGRS
ncbi:hypothetical protein NMY22_g13522 [Coprinellus aureogranulatus]|nr:hypothetical protein NMY22_g13522 [Coprinellus aureogranulatus]